jgi:hypothetical protein
VVGVIPSTKRCARDAGFRFDQPLNFFCLNQSLNFNQSLNYPHLAASKDCAAIDGYCSAPCGPPSSCELYTHLSEDKRGAVQSSGTKRPSSLARPSRRPARRRLAHESAGSLGQHIIDAPMRAARAPIEAATGLSERVRSAAIETEGYETRQTRRSRRPRRTQ